MRRVLVGVALSVLVSGALMGCPQNKEEQGVSAAKRETAKPPDAPTLPSEALGTIPDGGVGTIEGDVTFVGQAPEPQPLKTGVDPICSQTQKFDEELRVTGGKVANVVIRIRGIPGSPSAEPVVVDQKNCAYEPRVQAAVRGQKVQIFNSDQTLHNVHTFDGNKTLFNIAQPAKAPPIERPLDANGAVKFRCDVHPWMRGWVVYADGPHFAVTQRDGAFILNNVPAGIFDLEAWHEKLGMKSTRVTVDPTKPTQVRFTYQKDDRAK